MKFVSNSLMAIVMATHVNDWHNVALKAGVRGSTQSLAAIFSKICT